MDTIMNMVNSQIFKVSIILFFLSGIIMSLAKTLKTILLKDKRKTLLYALFIFVSFALTGLLSSHKVFNDVALNSFIGFQIVFLILGIVNVYVLRTYFLELTEDKKLALSNEVLFTLFFLFIGLVAFSNLTLRFRPAYGIIFLSAGLCFIIPLLFFKSFEFALKIPIPLFKQWQYPIKENIEEVTNDELKNTVVIQLKFKKKPNEDSANVINFTIKAPLNMQFSRLFYIFINDYNDRHPESTIEYLDTQTNEPDKWVFYFQPKWYASLKHIDFTKTVYENTIKEHSTIICERV